MIFRTADKWRNILSTLEVAKADALQWSSIFSLFFQGNVFSAGDKELPDFLSTILHESARLSKMEEDLNYTAERMMQVWPTRFPNLAATAGCVNNPKVLAAKVYNGRYGNYKPTDGWDFRGSGLIGTTFRSNYQFLETQFNFPFTTNPDLLRHPGLPALRISHGWWEGKVPDAVMGNPRRVRFAINGGEIGLEDTTALYNQLKVLLT